MKECKNIKFSYYIVAEGKRLRQKAED